MANEADASPTAPKPCAVEDERDNPLLAPLMSHEPRTAVQAETNVQMLEVMEVTKDTECGMGVLRGRFIQKYATQNVFAVVYGLLGCFYSAAYAYQNGTNTTVEKRFRIPSTAIGVIMVGSDISQLFVSLFLSYYAGKGHRPRWIGFGAGFLVLYCLMTALPHFVYGPGEDALSLTNEFASRGNITSQDADKETLMKMCVPHSEGTECEESESALAPVLILLAAQFISGIGATLFYNVGTAYMDDNIHRNRTPALISYSFFLRTLGFALGFALASFCLNFYISPTLTPTIDKHDPRWLGAWWMGWLLLGALLTFTGYVLSMFPKVLPKAAARKALERAQAAANNLTTLTESPPSFSDMMATFKRILKNPTYMWLNASSFFYFFGYVPVYMYMPKYIETQYRQSASFSSLVTGGVGLVFSAVGILLAGIVITKYKPTARHMSVWNTLSGLISAAGIVSYIFLGCSDDASPLTSQGVTINTEFQTVFECNVQCNCEYVSYSPVCAEDGKTNFISACHAGCSSFTLGTDGQKTYTNCSCIPPKNADPLKRADWTMSSLGWLNGGEALPGLCPKDCTKMFIIFLSVVCLLKFSGATARATNFLVFMRCVEERDKPAAMGLGVSILCLFSFIPAPIFAGYLIDTTCLVWGKTCSGKGNCWLYNDESLRYVLNIFAAVFIFIGSLCDAAVWFYVKDMEIYEENSEAANKSGRESK